MNPDNVRVVVDTNVLISAALLPTSRPYEVLTRVLDYGVLVLSNETFEEIGKTLSRRKFDRYVSRNLRERFLVDLSTVAEWTTITGALRVCRDPDDDAILETALRGQANVVVTGDRDLLTLHPFRDITILSPTNFLASSG